LLRKYIEAPFFQSNLTAALGLISTLYINILVVDIGGKIILKWILKLEQDCILDSAGPGQGPVMVL
jgi:hypothetical protein